MVVRFYKEDFLTLLNTKYKSSRNHGFWEKGFVRFSNCKYIGANDPQGGAIFDPRDMIGRIYVEHHTRLLYI